MVRTLTLLMALWTFLLLMPLCVGGGVLHPWEEGQSATCPHEDGCAQDPCALKVVPSDSLQQLIQHYPVTVQLLPVMLSFLWSLLPPGLAVAGVRLLPSWPEQPYP